MDMARSLRVTVAAMLVSVAVGGLGAVGVPIIGPGTASAAAQVCPKLSVAGSKYTWETVGTGFTCGSAKPLVVKLIKDRVDTSSGKVQLTNGPKGYHCYAVGDTKGVASDGQCYKGTLAFPKSGFAWSSV
jgi:hypothetical protein